MYAIFLRRLVMLSPAFFYMHCALADISVEDAYVRGLPPGVSNTSAYMTLVNSGDTAKELVAASADIAGSVMLHSTMEHDGMLHMQHVQSVLIPAGGRMTLKSGGTHLMLMALKQSPKPGDEVMMTLQFSDGSSETIALPVRSVLDE